MSKFARYAYTLTASAGVVIGSMMVPISGRAANTVTKTEKPVGVPTKMRTDDLVNPLGLDDQTPRFAWQLADGRQGARQTAYQIQVATRRDLLTSGKPDAWDSGKVDSDQSLGVVYKGSALAPTKRYYWRLMAWDKDGKAYPASEVSYWETGLLGQENWRGKWIGYQSWDEAAVRTAGAMWVTTPDVVELEKTKASEQKVAYRLPIVFDKPVKQAFLFATGQDVASAWINGAKVATGAALTPWKQMPWKKYVQTDVTSQLKSGTNILAIEITHYVVNPNGQATNDPPPMSATLIAQLTDGSVVHFASDAKSGWKTSIRQGSNWMMSTDEDASWKPVIAYMQEPGPLTEPLGNPWPTQSVKALRCDFEIRKPIASARLYATALGAYQVFLNGKRAGDDVLAPGWTEYRLRLKYQTYDVTSLLTQGGNAFGALVAPGWYSTPLEWFQQPNVYGLTAPSLMAQLRIEYSDGSVDWVATDDSWKASQSPVLKSEIYDGETQDARLIQPGWNAAHFAAKGWKPVEIHTPDLTGIKIDGQDYQSIRVERTLTPKAMTEPQPGVYIFDMGQNFPG